MKYLNIFFYYNMFDLISDKDKCEICQFYYKIFDLINDGDKCNFTFHSNLSLSSMFYERPSLARFVAHSENRNMYSRSHDY